MPSLTIKNIPEKVYKNLKRRAEFHRRSINSEVINCLEKATSSQKVDVESTLKDARELRNRIGLKVSNKELFKLKNEGRP
ncbi:MAG: Arc family DNA-binding protein [Bacteroidetes bacterium]|nr:Arc family DNA-binding protein [Bacteroidota bacterium]